MRLVAGLVVALACTARAQTNGARRPTAADSVFARAKQLVVNGNGAAGRVLVDSMIASAEPDTPAYAEALYWRAALAAASPDAERDYRRIVIEYPSSPRESEALLQLGQLEEARGDRAAAASHFERFVLENPDSPERARIGLQLVRLTFDLNDVQRGCISLGRVLSGVPASEVEMRNQLEYYSPRCAGVDTTRTIQSVPQAQPASATAPTPPARDSAVPAANSKGKFTLQVAAYTSRTDADRLVKKLKARGIDARVAGTSKLYRVRVGHYATRAAAAAAAKQLKVKKIDAFVAEVGADDK